MKHLITLFSLFIILTVSFASAEITAGKEEKEAGVFIQKISDKTIQIIKSGPVSEQEREKKLNKLFLESVDTKWMSKFVLGRYWLEASEGQKSKYNVAYEKFLLNSYVPKFKQYTDEKIEINKVTAEEGKNEFLVSTTIISPGDPARSIQVNYKVRKTGRSYKVFDVIAEGVSLITTERSDFGSVVSRKGLDHLIATLETRSTSQANSGK